MIFAEILQDILKKKIILRTLGAWSMSGLYQQLSDPEYYTEDCRIYDLRCNIIVKIKALLLHRESQHIVFYLVGFLWLTLAKYLSN